MLEVLISKMFIGIYNQNNIGHEIINFYKPDNCDDSYIYNPPHGKGKKVDSVILCGVPEKYAYPVLAIALNVKTVDNSIAESIKYGGKKLKDINFDCKDAYNEKYNIIKCTYKVPQGSLKQLPVYTIDGTTQKRTKQIYIIPSVNKKFTKEMQQERIKELKENNCDVIVLEKENPQHSCTYCKCDEVYNKDLFELICEAKYFNEYELLKVDLFNKHLININENSFLHFTGKEYSEQVFTNMLYNVLNYDKKNIKDFVELLLTAYNLENGTNLKTSNISFEISREKATTDTSRKGRLDLLIHNEDYIIIIENKINSQLNGLYKEEDIMYTQLDTYKKYAETLKIKNPNLVNAKILTFVFVPNYSSLKDMKGTITYKQLYEYFKRKTINIPGDHYLEFINGLAIHSLTKNEEINRRFINALKN